MTAFFLTRNSEYPMRVMGDLLCVQRESRWWVVVGSFGLGTYTIPVPKVVKDMFLSDSDLWNLHDKRVGLLSIPEYQKLLHDDMAKIASATLTWTSGFQGIRNSEDKPSFFVTQFDRYPMMVVDNLIYIQRNGRWWVVLGLWDTGTFPLPTPRVVKDMFFSPSSANQIKGKRVAIVPLGDYKEAVQKKVRYLVAGSEVTAVSPFQEIIESD